MTFVVGQGEEHWAVELKGPGSTPVRIFIPLKIIHAAKGQVIGIQIMSSAK